MATIKVRVNGEIATNLTPEVKLVCQNDKYDVEFEFDESWSKSNFKTALFIYNGKSIAVPFDRGQNGNVCKIPSLYDTELLHIGVKSDDIGGLHTSTPARVGCLLSANDIANGEIPNPTPSQYDEIIALLNLYISGGGSGGTDEERVREIAGEIVDDKIATEIPAWAKEPTKPSYTAEEVGALPSDTPLFSGDYNDLTNKPEIPSMEGVATEEYVDEKIGSIETALDSIIALQNSLIGG